MKILLNNYIIFISLFLFILSSVITSNTFSQTSSSVETFSETVTPLNPFSSKDDKLNLDEDEDIKTFLQELKNSDSKVLNLPKIIENSNDIFYDKDNFSEGINIFNDNDASLLLDELSNSNVVFSNEKDLINDNLNNKSVNEEKSFLSISDNKSLNFPLVNKSELDKVRISSIGLENNEFIPKNLNLWSETSFKRAIYLINNIDFNINSNVLKKTIKEILTVSNESPTGSINLENLFINKKLMLLANLNELDALYKFIDLLPEDESFDFWRSLRVKHYFLEGEFETDRLACNIVNDVTLNNNDNFWKKAQIFCQIIQGKEDDALFEAELLKASGSKDENFFNLLDALTQQSENFLIDETSLNLLDIAMMDQIRNIIPNEFIFKTPKYNYLALLNIENIQPETKAFMVDELLKNKSITIKETEFFYNMIGDSFLEFDQAFNNLKLNSGPQSRADIWNALKNSKDNKNLNVNILNVIENELANGRSVQSLSLLINLFNFSDNISETNNFNAREIKVIFDIFNGREFQENDGINRQFFEDLFSLSPNQELPLAKMIEYNIQDSIPILQLFDITVSQGDYLDLYLNGDTNTLSIDNNTLLKMALIEATVEGNIVEALVAQTLMLKDYNLNKISSKTIYDIVLSLVNLEMKEVAKELFREWLVANLISYNLNPINNKKNFNERELDNV